MQCNFSEHLCACNMSHSDFWIANEKLIWWGSEAGVRVTGASRGNSKSLYMMRFQLVHYSHCYLCISGSCQYPVGLSAEERMLDIFGKAFLRNRKARMEELNNNMSISSRRGLWNCEYLWSLHDNSLIYQVREQNIQRILSILHYLPLFIASISGFTKIYKYILNTWDMLPLSWLYIY